MGLPPISEGMAIGYTIAIMTRMAEFLFLSLPGVKITQPVSSSFGSMWV
jgi:hypothetical protein